MFAIATVPLMVTILDMSNASNIGADDGEKIANGMVMGMREILFRGKRVATATFVYGFYSVFDNRNHSIVNDNGNYWVIPETVGQFTGLTDKNGTKIFEGDILKDDWGKVYEVFYTLKSCSFMVKCTIAPNEFETGNYRLGEAWCNTIKVIGNIHDNSELIGGKGNA